MEATGHGGVPSDPKSSSKPWLGARAQNEGLAGAWIQIGRACASSRTCWSGSGRLLLHMQVDGVQA